MNLIYNSDQYSVVEFGVDDEREALRFGGYEIMDKSGKRELFLGGTLAKAFRADVEELIASEPSVEDVDSFLGKYDAMMRQPMVLH
ncbi:MAG: BTH_I0359 family protein [Burkholderiaceae bacterium]